jgi:hypothetical protein
MGANIILSLEAMTYKIKEMIYRSNKEVQTYIMSRQYNLRKVSA